MANDAIHTSSNLPPTYLPSPEAAVLDATFYYVLCTMVLLAAVFGNFLLVSKIGFSRIMEYEVIMSQYLTWLL